MTTDQTETLNEIIEFMDKQLLSVISTIHSDGSGVESALIAFCQTEDGEIIFGTSATSRKYRNLMEDGRVAFVVGFDGTVGSVQYEGIARELTPEESPPYADLLIQKNPGSKKYANDPDQRYFLTKPVWVRYINNISTPPSSKELSFPG